MMAQGGKSMTMENAVGWKLDTDPEPILYIGPTKANVTKVVEPKIDRMIRGCESLKAKTLFGQKYTSTKKIISGTSFRLAWAGSTTEIKADTASMVLVDEIGRGTSTYDGLSLAWACAEYLATNIQAYTLFASHYFELTLLAEQIPTLKNVHLDAIEHDDNIIFMHAVQEGAASKSFGLQVAQLAGIPKSVVQRAKQRLHELEQQESATVLQVAEKEINTSTSPAQSYQQLNLIDTNSHVIERLNTVDVNNLTPKQALDLLFELKDSL